MAQRPVKVAILTMFEPGRGREGELTRFRAGLNLRPWTVPGIAAHRSWRNSDGVAALVAGVGPVNTAVHVLSWALQSGADWRKTHWLICGIAGGNPAACSLGSTAWAEWVVDGDLAHDIHPADAPRTWATGILPLGASRPFERADLSPGLFGRPAQVFHLNGKLARWAWKTSRDTELVSIPPQGKLPKDARKFRGIACRPRVLRGDVLSAARFWHGATHQAWAERWVPHWTSDKGRFVMASMEDCGTLGALKQLHRLGLADWNRVMLLRGASNYTVPPQKIISGKVALPAMGPALENLWRTAKPVIEEFL